MKVAVLFAIIGIIVGGKLAGLYLIGSVGSGSMEPVLPQDALFFAIRGSPDIGDVVVFEVPSGERIVHRVVGIQPGGALVTQGDANEQDDVASGIGPVDPRNVLIVPQTGGIPWHFSGPLASPVVLGIVQVVLVGLGLAGIMADNARQGRPPIRASTLVFAAAATFILVSPLFHDTVDANSQVGVRASVFPVVARVWNETDDQTVHVAAMDEVVVPAAGVTHVANVPAVPGSAYFLRYGVMAGTIPSAGLLASIAALLRSEGH